MSSKHLCNFVSILNLAVKTKKASIGILIKTNYIKLFIDLLMKYNFIYGYRVEKLRKRFLGVQQEKIFIHFKPDLIKEINLMSSPSYKRSVNVYQLRSLQYKNRGTCYIVSSSKLKAFEISNVCLQNNTGGLLICAIVLSM
jgi:ribosomal protein S8